MGQKVNPVGFRLGTSRDHDSVWYAKSKDYSKLVLEDIKVRDRVREIVIDSGSEIESQRFIWL